MNSFPTEFVHQHYPCMHVAGLNKPSTDGADAPETESSHALKEPAVHFPGLSELLRDAFLARGGTTAWDPSVARSPVFHSVLIERSIRLPPRKTQLAAGPSQTNPGTLASQLPARSPLSPLHLNSPLFPDGIMTPLWIRRYREQMPAVHVAFHCLTQLPAQMLAPSEGPAAVGDVPPGVVVEGQTEAQMLQQLKVNDEAIIAHISHLLKTLNERGVKLTVVLLTTHRMLSHPSLEARLSYIRHNSGLDAKSSLFVLTHVAREEINAFVASLHTSLHDAALDFYREQARRVRRKRTRNPPPASVWQPIAAAHKARSDAASAPDPVPLTREGWHVRAEFKLGTFAEFAGDIETALQHYIEAKDMLGSSRCLGSTSMLPPRTKRWAEAKVLADTLNIRICRLHMYQYAASPAGQLAPPGHPRNDSQLRLAMQSFQQHIKRFTELSTGWGIGDATFEFWSWLAKQYRMFADQIDQATGGTPPLELPAHAPPLPSNLLPSSIASGPNAPASVGPLLAPSASALAEGAAPLTQMPSPGHIYYLAAICTMERRNRFNAMVANGYGQDEKASGYPALMHEKQVDHTAQIGEVLTLAYEHFKRAGLTRHVLFVATKIALNYFQAERYETALPFLKRITETYRDEEQDAVLRQLVHVQAECAQRLGDNTSEVHALCDLLSFGLDSAGPLQRLDDLGVFSSSSSTDAAGPITYTSSSTRGFMHVSCVFAQAEAPTQSPVDFQLSVAFASASSETSKPLAFKTAEIFFEGCDEAVFRLSLGSRGSSDERLSLIGSASLEEAAIASNDLVWLPGRKKVWQGQLSAARPTETRLSKVVLLTGGNTPLCLVIDYHGDDSSISGVFPTWLSPSLSPIALPYRATPADRLVIVPAALVIDCDLRAPHCLFNGERATLPLQIVSHEDAPSRLFAEVYVQSVGTEGAGDDAQATTSMLEGSKPLPRTPQGGFALGIQQGQASRDYTVAFDVPATICDHCNVAIVIYSERHDGQDDITEPSAHAAKLVLRNAVEVRPLLRVRPVFGPLRPRPSAEAWHFCSLDFDVQFCNGAAEVETLSYEVKPLMDEKCSAKLVGPDPFSGAKWADGDRAEAMHIIHFDPSCQEEMLVSMSIRWRRSDASVESTFTSVFTLRDIHPLPAMSATIHTPGAGVTDRLMPIRARLANSDAMSAAPATLSVSASSPFAIVGSRETALSALLPGTTREVNLQLLPLTSGPTSLPAVHLRLAGAEADGDEQFAPVLSATGSALPLLAIQS